MPQKFAFTTALAIATMAVWSQGAIAQSSNDGLTLEGLATGQVVEEKREPGSIYVKDTFNDWALRCITAEEGEDPCQMYQILVDETGQPVVEFTLLRLPSGERFAAAATVKVPLETSLRQQLSITVDDGDTKRYAYDFCNRTECIARLGLTDEDIEGYKDGSAALVSLVPALDPSQTPIRLNMSLSGFTAAFGAVSVINP